MTSLRASEPLYSLVIPVFNEEEVLPLLFERVVGVAATLDAPAEIVFVNDGSRDRSLRLLQDFARARRNVRVLSFSRNFGHQLAITAGMQAAAGDATIVLRCRSRTRRN